LFAPVGSQRGSRQHARQRHTTAVHIPAIRGAAGDLCPCL